MIRRPPRSTLDRSSAASDVYKRQGKKGAMHADFDHDKFAAICGESEQQLIVSYNNSQLVRDRFKRFQVGEFDLTYTMRSVGNYMSNQKERKELVLTNY